MEEYVVLVDTSDNQLGTMEKFKAHVDGRLHRAFSILLYDDHGRMLITQRAGRKYHSSGLWTNACCSHQRSGESTQQAADRRLREELGITTDLTSLFFFHYRAELNNGLIEHELDHVLAGVYNQEIEPNDKEVQDWRYVDYAKLLLDLNENADRYTHWFKLICGKEYRDRIAPSVIQELVIQRRAPIH